MIKAYVPIFFILLYGFAHHKQVVVVHRDIANVEALQSFFAKLDAIQMDSNQVAVVHIGDSHIQADFLSGAVRKKLQAKFGNAGRGFVFPYNIARSGGALDVKFAHTGAWEYCTIKRGYATCNLGVSGFTVSPSEDASFSIDVSASTETEASFNKVTFIGQYGSFLPTGANGNFAPIKENGHTVIHFDELQEKLDFKPAFEKNLLPELQGMVLENGQPGILYHALGVNGSTVSQYLRSSHFESQINDLDASLVIISFGTNDSYTTASKFCAKCAKEKYRTLVARIRSKNPNAAILLTTPPDHYFNRKHPNSNVAQLRNKLLELSEEEDIAIWDLYEVMGGENSIVDWKRDDLARGDLIHFTAPGYELQGDLLYQALMQGYNSN